MKTSSDCDALVIATVYIPVLKQQSCGAATPTGSNRLKEAGLSFLGASIALMHLQMEQTLSTTCSLSNALI